MDAKRWLDHAKEQIEKQNYHKAEDLLKNAIQFDNTCTMAHEELAMVSIHRGKYQQAKTNFEKVLTLEPTTERRIKYGGILLMLDQPEMAEDQFIQVLDSEPDNVDAKKGLGDSYFRQKNFKDAIKTYDKLLEDNPDDAFIWYSKAETYYRAQDHEAALGAIDQAINLEAAPEFFAFKGDFFIRHENFERALEQYRLAANMNPNDAEIKMRLGFIYRILNRHRDAIDAFNEALELDPYHREALENKIELLEDMGQTEAARATTEQLVRLYPEDLNLGMSLAQYYIKHEGYERASQIFEILITEHRDEPEVWYGLARSMYEIDEYERANEAIQMAITTEPDVPDKYDLLQQKISQHTDV